MPKDGEKEEQKEGEAEAEKIEEGTEAAGELLSGITVQQVSFQIILCAVRV